MPTISRSQVHERLEAAKAILGDEDCDSRQADSAIKMARTFVARGLDSLESKYKPTAANDQP